MRAAIEEHGLGRRLILVLALVAAVAALLVYAARDDRASALQGDCGDWVNETSDRVGVARQLLSPAERQEQSTGSVQGDAQALYDLAQEQANANPPDIAYYLHGDLIEAMATGSQALNGGGGSSGEAQIAFAKSIVYNADLRINAVADSC